MITDWDSLRRQESENPYWTTLQHFLDAERSEKDVYPPVDEVFAAFDLTPLAEVKVVILGQDPYGGVAFRSATRIRGFLQSQTDGRFKPQGPPHTAKIQSPTIADMSSDVSPYA